MNSLFKRSAIGLAVLGLTGSAFAYQHVGVGQGGMWMPNVNGAFIGAEGLYLRPQNGDLDFVQVIPAGVTGGPLAPYFTQAISTDYQWGWRVYGGIKFTDCDDITVSWLHFNQTYDDGAFLGTTSASIPGSLTPRWLFNVGPGTATSAAVGASAEFDLDEAYGVWGHTVRFNNPWSLRWAAGVEYARLDADMAVASVEAETGTSPLTTIDAAEGESSFTGWGPRLELDVNYGLPCGLAWFLRTNAVLLSAEREVELEGAPRFVSSGTTTVVYNSADWTDRNVIIPKFGMKIGASYSYFWGQVGSEGCGGCGTTLTAEIGWQADVYIHAIERPIDGYGINTSRNIVSVVDTKVSNYSDQGMFLGLKVTSDWM